ncbi:MAG: YggS family pyridoxal phosphate-dependent enzyme [Pirellulales bacterium]|nr:YggS family pyridoxal phosphate-dependent enzyme [Pirellulales bacterium]
MFDRVKQIAQNVAAIRGRIEDAAARSGRRGDEVELVAVTKYVGPDDIRALARCGCTVLGENRPQELAAKAAALADLPLRWHMIGTLQRNKVRRTLELVEMVQSIDGPKLLEAVDRIAGELGRRVPILLEVNISGEASKHGLRPDEVEPLLTAWPACENVELRGLMGMSSWGGTPDQARREFAGLRELRDRLNVRLAGRVNLAELSMGMSGDFETAIEEGATMARIGSALFEGLLDG